MRGNTLHVVNYGTGTQNTDLSKAVQYAETEAMELSGNSSILAFNKGSVEFIKNARGTNGKSKIPLNVIPVDMEEDDLSILAEYLTVKNSMAVSRGDLRYRSCFDYWMLKIFL